MHPAPSFLSKSCGEFDIVQGHQLQDWTSQRGNSAPHQEFIYGTPAATVQVTGLRIRTNENVTPTLHTCKWLSDDKICGFSSCNLENVVNHIDQEHCQPGRNPHHVCNWKNCERAGRTFSAKYKLINHIRVHTGQKPFKCDVCYREFARMENMKIHKRVHTS